MWQVFCHALATSAQLPSRRRRSVRIAEPDIQRPQAGLKTRILDWKQIRRSTGLVEVAMAEARKCHERRGRFPVHALRVNSPAAIDELFADECRDCNMGDELLLVLPRLSSQVVATAGVVQDFCLVEPERMGRREPGTPAPVTGPQLHLLELGHMAGVAVVNQVHSSLVIMTSGESHQSFDIVHRVLRLDARRFHQAAVNEQEVRNVGRPMASVLELSLLDRAGDGTTNRVAFQDLIAGYLIGADDAIALLGEAIGVGLAPKDFLSPLLELGIQSSGLPVASLVKLQIDVVLNPAYSPVTDRRHNTVGDGLSGQVLGWSSG